MPDTRIRALLRRYLASPTAQNAEALGHAYARVAEGQAVFDYIEDMECALCDIHQLLSGLEQDWEEDAILFEWVAGQACMTHTNPDVWEYILYIGKEKPKSWFGAIPTQIKPAIDEALANGYSYICFFIW